MTTGGSSSVVPSSYITCHDTDLDDLADTSISLQSILKLCGKSACKRIALFLDSCESGIADLPEVRAFTRKCPRMS